MTNHHQERLNFGGTSHSSCSTPDVSIPSKEPEQNPETSTKKVQNLNLENTAHVPPPGEEDSIFIEIPKPKAKKTVNLDPNSPNPNSYQSKLPYLERMKIGLKDALVEMPKFNKWLSSMLRNKEKLEEIAIITVNAECSAIIMNKVLEKLEDPRKFLIPCALQELNRTRRPFLRTAKALIDLYEETLTLRVGKEELVYYADKSEKNKEKNFVHGPFSIIVFSKDDPLRIRLAFHLRILSSASVTLNSLGNEDKVFKPVFTHNLWDVIVNGDLEEEPAPTTRETSAPPVPKTVKQLAARRNQERVKSILLLAIPDEYLLKFHNVADAKSLWEAIKSRFGGNVESKKMQKNVLKHQFEKFSTASNESLDKAYDRF
ncbi:hypothetical protein Tco_0086478 [Tanacetum coccineum]